MNVDKLKDYLINKHYSKLLKSSDPDLLSKHANGEITTKSIGLWIWVKVRLSGGATQKWYSRASSEYTSFSMRYKYDWVGLSENVPSKISQPKELEKWALLSTFYDERYQAAKYVYEGPDEDSSGCWVQDITEEGKVTIIKELVVKENDNKKTTATEYIQL